MLQDKIKKLSKQYLAEVIAIRRHLHTHPELSFEEYNTSAFIAERLKELNIPHQRGIAKTGIVATIQGNLRKTKEYESTKSPIVNQQSTINNSFIVALRADIDALPIKEIHEVSYKSVSDGIMHACGHDAHTASLLGTMMILQELKNEFEGIVKFIFQPGEEKLPGGASMMIKEGVLENPKVNAIFGQHVMPLIDAGKVGFRKGIYMASTDEIYVTVKGKGGHAAMPHQNIDPILIASHIIISLQQIVSRTAKPSIPTVLSFGKVIANGATNVIPDEVKLEGTFRTFDEKWRNEAHAKMKKIAESIAEGMGGKCEFTIVKGYPFLINDEPLTTFARANAEEYLGKENVEDLDIGMTAEDFAFYSQKIPACFYRLGVRNKTKDITSSVHTSTFDIDEKALETGMGLMAWLTLKELKQ